MTRSHRLCVLVSLSLMTLVPPAHGQRRGRGQPAESAKAAAAFDITGYWISVVTEDWKFRMVTPRKGDYDLVPLTPAGRSLADAWDPAKDEAEGNPCKAYGAAVIMRVPGRLHISWENDSALRMDIEAGTQSRLLQFGSAGSGSQSGQDPTWQGKSSAEWEYSGGGRGQARIGSLKVVTTHMRPGYLRKNGVPYSQNAVMTEYFRRLTTPNGEQWLLVITEISDPEYLTVPFVTSTQFKKIPDNSPWRPEACSAR
jgi:hypothetical protein